MCLKNISYSLCVPRLRLNQRAALLLVRTVPGSLRKIRTAIFPLGEIASPAGDLSHPTLSPFLLLILQICGQVTAHPLIGSFECCRDVRI